MRFEKLQEIGKSVEKLDMKNFLRSNSPYIGNWSYKATTSTKPQYLMNPNNLIKGWLVLAIASQQRIVGVDAPTSMH